MQIFVLGMHRSGTSAITRLINMMGAYFGNQGAAIPVNDHNLKGFWEREDFVTLNKQLLAIRGCNWTDVTAWPLAGRLPLHPEVVDMMRRFLGEMDAHRPWVLKDPRVCVTFADWLPLLEAPLPVIVARDPLEVARSLQQRDGMPIGYGVALWEFYAVHTIRNTAALPKVFINYDDVVTDPLGASRKLYDSLSKGGVPGLELPTDREILAFIDPTLHRARRADAAIELTSHQQKLEAMVRGIEPFESSIEVSPESRAVVIQQREARARRFQPS
jgi:hypothetical protein